MKSHIGKMYLRLDEHRIDEDARAMKAYMKGHFDFFGIKTEARRSLTKLHNKGLGLAATDFLPFAKICFEYPEREMHHYALDTIASFKKKYHADTVKLSEFFCEKNAWWDIVDSSNSFINKPLFKKDKGLLENKVNEWMQDANFWKRRLAIIAQLKFGTETNTNLLEKAIGSNLGSTEFFINKAIGWALREYAHYNPDWVLDYASRTELHSLSRKEALRKILH